jgi:opacity protein-like surface antigen
LQIFNKVNVMKKISSLLVAGALSVSAAAWADKSSTYVFVNALYNDVGSDVKDASTFDPARTGPAATTTWSIDPAMPVFGKGDVSDDDVGFRIGGGLNFAEHWGVEVSFAQYGTAVDTLELGGGNDIELATRARSFSVDVIRYFALTDNFSLYGKAGIDAWSTDIRAHQQNKDADSDKDSGYMPTIGIGARLSVHDNIDITTELSYRLYNSAYKQHAQQANPTVPPGSMELNTSGRYEEVDIDVEIVSFSIGAAFRF